MKKFLLLGLVLLTVVMGATSALAAGKPIVFALGAEPVSLDPPNQTDNPSEMVVRTIHDNLVNFDEKMNIVPMLAKSWDISPDGLVYTFHLRQGIKFHDGTPFNAQAVVANVQRNLDLKNRTRRTSLYEPFIAKVEAADDHTVKMTLKKPFGALLAHFAHGAGGMVSPAALKKYGDKLGLHPVGTGPYKFVEWVPGDRVVLERNDDYWGGKPKTEKVIFKAVPEAASRVIMLETGEADVVYPVPLVEVDRLRKMKNVRVEVGDTARVMYIGMHNLKKPFNDIRVRQALNYAVDKESIVKNILKGMAKPSHSMIGSLVWGYSDAGYYKYDPEKAKKLLAEAGYPDGFETTIWSPEGRYPMDAQISEAVVGMFQKIGVKAKLRKWEWAAYLKNTRKTPEEAKYDMFFIGWAPSTGDADWGLRPLFYSKEWAPQGANRCFYKSEEVDKGLEAGMGTADPAKRKAIYAKVQKKLFDDAPWIMLHDMSQSVGVNAKLKNVILWPLEIVLVGGAYFE